MIRLIFAGWLLCLGIGAAYAQDPYLYQLQQQTLLMQQQQLDNMRYQQQQQNRHNGYRFDYTLPMQVQQPDIAGSYAESKTHLDNESRNTVMGEIERLKAVGTKESYEEIDKIRRILVNNGIDADDLY